MGTALLAYSFGLCHAVDADHIAAIDSVTRLGYGIIGIFAFGWLAPLVIYKVKRYDAIEATF
jgi:high-affinity nickel permease